MWGHSLTNKENILFLKGMSPFLFKKTQGRCLFSYAFICNIKIAYIIPNKKEGRAVAL